MRGFKFLVFAVASASAFLGTGLLAQGRNDHQIEWMISAQDWSTADHAFEDGVHRYDLKARPSRLYLARADVIGENGTILLPAGSQFYGMTGQNLTVCSQQRGPEGTLGYNNRVCLLDEDGDGSPDVYWFRAFGRSFLRLDDWWFAMNAEPPRTKFNLQVAELEVSDPALANVLLDMELTFSIRSRSRIRSTINVDHGDRFIGRCLPEEPVLMEDGWSESSCLAPDIRARTRNLDARKWREREIDLELPRRDVRVYFLMSSGLIAGRNMEAILLR